MPPLEAWFSGTALFFAGSFAFGITVGLIGIKRMMSKKIFTLLEIAAVILTACAWWSAAGSEATSAVQKSRLDLLPGMRAEQGNDKKMLQEYLLLQRTVIDKLTSHDSSNFIDELRKTLP